MGPRLLTPAPTPAACLLACSPARPRKAPRPFRTIPTFNSRAWSPVPCKTEISLTAKVDEGGCTSPGGWERFAKPIAAEVAFLAVLATTGCCRCRWRRGRWQSDGDGLEVAAHAITTRWLTVQARAHLGGGAISETPKIKSVARKSNSLAISSNIGIALLATGRGSLASAPGLDPCAPGGRVRTSGVVDEAYLQARWTAGTLAQRSKMRAS